MADIRVFYSNSQQSVIVEGAKEFTPGNGALLASADPGSADGIIVTYPDLIDQTNRTKQLLGPISYTRILQENGTSAGGDRATVINYLNAQFVEGGNGGVKPTLTSQFNIDAIVGEHFSYNITADDDPTWFDISTTGLYTVNQSNGQVQGEVTLGAQTIEITAGNAYGADSNTLTVTGIAAGGWTNTYSIMFRRMRQQAIEFGSGSALNFASTDPFSLSVWTDENRGGIVRRIADDGSGYELEQDSGRDIFFRLRSDNPANFIEVEASNIPNNQWTYLTVTYDGSETAAGVKIYFDGVSQSLTTHQNNFSGSVTATAKFQAGYTDDVGFSNANLDELAVYDKELSGAEITTIYNSGTPDDLNSIGPTGNLVGYWRMGDGDSYPTIGDNSVNTNNGTMVNMTISNIENNVP